ncbi:MAG: HAD family hydrolase [Cyanobacteria bacterium J06634_5]
MATIQCGSVRFENIQAVLFDKDGTLANVERYLVALGELRSHLVATSLYPTNAELAQDFADDLLKTFGQTRSAIAPDGLMAVGSRYDNEIAAAAAISSTGVGWIASCNQAQLAFQQAEATLSPKVLQTPPLDGMSVLLSSLKTAGLQIGIVSSDVHPEVAAFVSRYTTDEISWYCGAGEQTLPKTHPDFLQFACDSMAVDPAATLVMGDSAADWVLAAGAASPAAGFVAMTGGWQQPPTIDFRQACIPIEFEGAGPEGAGPKGTASQRRRLTYAVIESLSAVEAFK